jgi:predicted metal-dependent hydrolase
MPENVKPIDPADWMACPDYLYAIDLYHEGYFWEAHEAWEGLWHAAGRDTTAHGRLLRALIRLTAAYLKLRAGVPRGAWQHSLGAHALLGEVQAMIEPGSSRYLGLDLDGLRHEIARHFAPIWASEGRALDTLDAPPRLRLASPTK